MSNNSKISIVSPVYGAEGIVHILVKEIEESVKKITDDYEILLIEDKSPDKSWVEIVEIAASNTKVKGVKLSRNFGQHNAIAAGMEIASGDYVILLDCDLQHNPKYIIDLYKKINEGYDIVYAKFISRKHGFFKNLSAKLYYRFLKFTSDFDMDPNIGSFSILSRKVVDAFNQFNDYKKTYLLALKWIGFNYSTIDVKHRKRTKGKSGYSLKKLLIHSLSISIANSDKLLYISFYIGIITSLLSFLGIFIIILRYFIVGALEGWSSLIIVIMFFSGLILTTLGITSVYLGKVYEQTKGRPRYLISKKINFND